MFRDSGSLSRRQFLSWLGWGSVALSVGGVVTASAVSLRPRRTAYLMVDGPTGEDIRFA